jgi:hypothetical protein
MKNDQSIKSFLIDQYQMFELLFIFHFIDKTIDWLFLFDPMKEISCYLFSRFTLYIYLLILEIATNPRYWEQSFWKGRPLFEVDELTCSGGRGSWVFGECHAACMFQIIIESTPNQPHFVTGDL